MPALFDSSATSTLQAIAGSSTSGSVSAAHTVSTIASNLYGIVTIYWTGTVNPSSATFSASFGGTAMTPVSGGTATWGPVNGWYTTMRMFALQNPPTGARTVTASFSGMSPTGSTQYLGFVSESYSGVASMGSAVSATSSNPALVIPSATGQMAVGAYTAVEPSGVGDAFSSFSGTTRVNTNSIYQSNTPLLIGDAAGATGIVDLTVTPPAGATGGGWGGIGVQLVGPAVAYDATGAGDKGLKSSFSWSHTIGANAALVVAVGVEYVSNYAAAPSLSVTVGAQNQALTLLGSIPNFVNYYGYVGQIWLYGIPNPPTGSQTINVTASRGVYGVGNSVSYTGVVAFGQVATGTSFTDTITVASTTPANTVVSAHAVTPPPLTPNVFTYNQTRRAMLADNPNQLMVVGDAPGAPNVMLSATMNSQNGWGALGVNLTPAPVMLNVSALIGPILTSATLADYRSHTPSPIRTYVVPATGVQPVLTNGRLGPQWTQANDSVLDYTFDWTNWLESTADTIAHVTFTPSDPSIQVISTNVNGAIATGWLTGGITGDVYSIVVHITTIDGRQDDRTFTLIITQT